MTRPIVRTAPPLDLLPPPSRWKRTKLRRRELVLVLAAWLFVSGVMWPHSAGSVVNEVMFGAVLFGAGAVALYVEWVRWIVAATAIGLVVATLTTHPLVEVTRWNDLAVAVGVIAASVVGKDKDKEVRVGQQVQEVMTKDIQTVRKSTPLREVARVMHDRDIGVVLVTDNDGSLVGVVTDRDLVVRGLASDRSVDDITAGEVSSAAMVAKLAPTASLDEAVVLMRQRNVRRLPVVADGKPVGIVSIGDLARAKDPTSALAEISRASPNR